MAVTDGGGEGGAGLADMDVARAESTLDFAGLMMIVYKSVCSSIARWKIMRTQNQVSNGAALPRNTRI
jgi:hypothetical protein